MDITHGKGPTFTNQHLTLPNHSYIDHILSLHASQDLLKSVSVLQPDPINTSDHLPVAATFSIPQINDPIFDTSNNFPETEQIIPNYMWKNKKFIEQYQSKISN